jgi:hypothetical protein
LLSLRETKKGLKNQWTVPPMWKGQLVVIIGSGPSLTENQIVLVREAGHRVLVINDNYLRAPWADLLYACDQQWWRWHHEKALKFVGLKVTCSDVAAELYRENGLLWLPGYWRDGLSLNPSLIHLGKSSGYQAVNIAFLAGVKRILLLGFDHRQIDQKPHWFGDHPNKVRSHYAGWFKPWATVLPSIAGHDCEIINVTPNSALPTFPMMDLETALAL